MSFSLFRAEYFAPYSFYPMIPGGRSLLQARDRDNLEAPKLSELNRQSGAVDIIPSVVMENCTTMISAPGILLNPIIPRSGDAAPARTVIADLTYKLLK